MHRMYEHSEAGLISFSGGPHAPVNTVDSMEEVNVQVEKNTGNGILEVFAALYYAIFHTPSFCKSLNFLGTSITSSVKLVHLPYVFRSI